MKRLILALLLTLPSFAVADDSLLSALLRNQQSQQYPVVPPLQIQPVVPLPLSYETNALINSMTQQNKAQELLAIDELARRRSNGNEAQYMLNRFFIEQDVKRKSIFPNW